MSKRERKKNRKRKKKKRTEEARLGCGSRGTSVPRAMNDRDKLTRVSLTQLWMDFSITRPCQTLNTAFKIEPV